MSKKAKSKYAPRPTVAVPPVPVPPAPRPVGRPPKMVKLTVLIDQRFMAADPTETILVKEVDGRVAEILANGIELKKVNDTSTTVFPSSIYGIRKKEL